MIEKLINNYEYVSFDVFDTLIERKCLTPEQIFINTGRKVLGNRKKIKFLKLRKQAEEDAYNELGVRATLDDIYSNITAFSDKTIDDLKNEEIHQELENCYPKEIIDNIYKYAIKRKKKIIIISDMYLSENIISQMVKKCGYDKYEKLYVSNEYGVDKRSGKLFDLVLKKENITSNDIIHIGDSLKADILGARRNNIKSIFIPRKKMISRYLKKIDG